VGNPSDVIASIVTDTRLARPARSRGDRDPPDRARC
jgi:hypothetical protein